MSFDITKLLAEVMEMQYARFLLSITLVCLHCPVYAYGWSQAELAEMPEYCQVRFIAGKESAEWKRWASILGHHALHMHHYCDGLGHMSRYRSSYNLQPHKKRRILIDAYNSFMYMVQRVDSSWPLEADLYYNLGVVLQLLEKRGEAIKALQKSVAIDPKKVQSYTALAELFEKSGNKGMALNVVTDGLRHNPDSKELKKTYDRLGGKQPYPEPYAQQNQRPTEPTWAEAQQKQNKGNESSKTDKPAEAAEPTPRAASTPAPIGTPNNPWCRFCPEPTASSSGQNQ